MTATWDTPRHVAVVVPVHNEQALLPRCLTALRRALRSAASPDLGVQVVVVLDACTDRSAAVCAAAPWLTVVHTSARNVGAARSLGCAAAIDRSPVSTHRLWLATTDADSEVPFHWLTHQVMLAGRGHDAVLGTVDVRSWAGWPQAVRAAYDSRYRSEDDHAHVHGANLGVRASSYLRAGGFGARTSDEDVALVAALRTAGARVVTTGHAPVITSGRTVGRAPHGFSAHLRTLAAQHTTSLTRDAQGA